MAVPRTSDAIPMIVSRQHESGVPLTRDVFHALLLSEGYPSVSIRMLPGDHLGNGNGRIAT